MQKCDAYYHTVCSKGHFFHGQNYAAYSVQLKWTVALKGEKYQGGKGYKDIVTVLLYCNTDDREGLPPLIVGNFEESCCL